VRVGRAEAWREKHACERAFADYLTMVREHDLDAVLIATWPPLHREQVLGCLEAGVRTILCEKALALNGVEALEIHAAATEAGALVVEGYMYRHHPAVHRIDELLGAGEVGALDSVWAAFDMFDPEEAHPDDPSRDWRQRLECGGGVPYDLACYCVDACNRFAGTRPRQAQAVSGTSERYGTVDRLFGLIEYEDGLVGGLESSRRADSNHELRLSGALGHLRLPAAWRIEAPTEVLLTRSAGWGHFETTRFPIPQADPFRLQLERFALSARGDAAPIPTLDESVVNAVTMDALLASAAERGPIPVELPEALRA
jgi:predicted dehydrogenase